MAYTLRQLLDGDLKWRLGEKGLQRVWDVLDQICSSQSGSSITGGTTVLDDADIVDGDGTGIQKDTARTISGPFTVTGAEKTVTGRTVPPPDPGGNVGPTPARLSNSYPQNGFRNGI